MKQTKYLYTLFLAILITQAGFAQNEASRFIDVNGEAETEITPNIIKLSIKLTEYEKDRKVVSMDEIEGGFLKALDGSGLAEDKIVVTQVSSNAFNTKRRRKAFASKSYELTFSDQKELLNFTKRLKNTDIDYMYISQLSHTDIEQHKLKVKIRALKLAEAKAKALLEAVGSELGKVVYIKEPGTYMEAPQMEKARAGNMRMMSNTQADFSIAADDIGFKKIKIRFEINARFAIQ